MAIWSTGSISTHVGALIGWDNIPAGISGTVLNNMVEQEINFVELYTTDVIDRSAIQEKYQPSIIDLTMSKMLISIDASQGGINSVSLGDLSIAAGAGGNADLATQLRTDAINRLKELGRSIRFTRIHGC